MHLHFHRRGSFILAPSQATLFSKQILLASVQGWGGLRVYNFVVMAFGVYFLCTPPCPCRALCREMQGNELHYPSPTMAEKAKQRHHHSSAELSICHLRGCSSAQTPTFWESESSFLPEFQVICRHCMFEDFCSWMVKRALKDILF